MAVNLDSNILLHIDSLPELAGALMCDVILFSSLTERFIMK